jgi:hypothetical protein
MLPGHIPIFPFLGTWLSGIKRVIFAENVVASERETAVLK